MKKTLEKWTMSVLILLAVIGFMIFGKQFAGLGMFAYKKKKEKIDNQINDIKAKIEENEAKITTEKQSINENDVEIEDINIVRKQFEKELESAQTDHDMLDDMFASLLG